MAGSFVPAEVEMNRDEKAAVIDEVAGQIREAEAIFAVDYRGISVKDAAELRTRLVEAGAVFRVVKNRLTIRAADAAGAESLKELLEGPTAFAFVAEDGDVALAAKALAQFRRQTDALAFKGGLMGEDSLTIEQIESISRLPARETLNGQFVGVLASPLTTLVRGLASMISGLAIQLQQIQEQGLVGGSAEPAGEEPAAEDAPAAEAPAPAAEAEEGEAGEDATPTPQGDPVGDEASESETPSEGEEETE
jgi:large subunit ribosomal protein L10